jgi:long-chain fatty acid transport protein
MPHATRALCLIGAISVIDCGEAVAAGFAVRENSAESVATVFAGNASRADDVSTVFNNPAGMSELQGTQVEAGGALVLPNMHFSGSSSIAGTTLPGDNHREIGQAALIPHFYGVFDLDDRAKVGLAITAPFGNTVDYGNAWSGRYVNIKTSALALDINPNISYRLTDWLSVGGGVSLQYFRLGLETGIAQSVIFGPPTPDSSFHLGVTNWNWGYNLGVLAEPWQGTRLGFTYRSDIAHKMNGMLKLAPDTSPLLGLSTAPASTDLHLPASFTASVTQGVTSDFSLSSDVQLTQWHVFQNVAVVAPPNPTFAFTENYRDSWMVSVGGKYRFNETWSLLAGVGYDESPVTDGFRDAGVPDKDRYMIGFGPDIRLNEMTFLDVGYAYYFGASATMNKSINAVDPISGVVLHGNYENALNYLAVSLRKAL